MQRSINSLESLFQHALELPPDDRQPFLEALRREDRAAATRLESMLRGIGQADEFFARNPIVLASDGELMPSPELNEISGQRLGRYQIIEKLGEGGCGIVYLAEQEQPLRRRVALKIIKAGMDTASVITRFEAERQALALMDHPHIAKVFDAGSTDTGRPYFVMELVEGVKITEHCAEHQLSVADRLKLFLQVCDAVQHAHQKGIIHRDLKPSNIIVSGSDNPAADLYSSGSSESLRSNPTPKVIDFGIAKAIQGKLTTETIHTLQHQILGTPAYMSPEQVDLSADVDTRTDIYSLGVLLYELLTGRPPFDNHELLTAGLEEMRRIIREVEPKRPSGLVHTTDRLSIPSDLDWIVMRCLEKDRTRRYQTTSSLSMDIQRYLAGEPILARPASRIYCLKKFVQRNKVQMVASFAVAMALVAGTAVSTWQAINAKQAQHASREQAETARTVKDFLVRQLLGGSNPWERSAFDTNNYVVIQRIAREVEGQLTNQPLVEADVRYALGEALEGLDRFGDALSHYEKALALRTKHLGGTHSDTLLAAAQVGSNLHNLEQHREAKQVLDQAIRVIRTSALKPSKGAGEVLFTSGHYLITEQRLEEGMGYVKEALEMFRRSLGPDHERTSAAHFMMAIATQRLGKVGDAETLFKEGLARCIRAQGADGPSSALFLGGYGLLLISQQRWDEATEKLRSSVAIKRKVLGAEHTHTLEAETFLAEALEGNRALEAATELHLNLHQSWAKHLPYFRARNKLRETAAFFVRHRRYSDAKAVFFDLEKFLPHLPPENPEQFGMFLATTAAAEGWPAAAETCRISLSRPSESLHTSLHYCPVKNPGKEG